MTTRRCACRAPAAPPRSRPSARRVIVVLRHSRRAFVDRLDFITTAGHLTGGDARRRLGLIGEGPSLVITDLGLLTPDPDTKELRLTAIHPGVGVNEVKEATGWALKVAADLRETQPPTDRELDALRRLQPADERELVHETIKRGAGIAGGCACHSDHAPDARLAEIVTARRPPPARVRERGGAHQGRVGGWDRVPDRDRPDVHPIPGRSSSCCPTSLGSPAWSR